MSKVTLRVLEDYDGVCMYMGNTQISGPRDGALRIVKYEEIIDIEDIVFALCRYYRSDYRTERRILTMANDLLEMMVKSYGRQNIK